MSWPCATTKFDDCPGVGRIAQHCTACHRLYLGYVALCPMHNAAPKMFEVLPEAREEVAHSLAACGDCEHEINICVCQIRDRLAKIDAAIKAAEEYGYA